MTLALTFYEDHQEQFRKCGLFVSSAVRACAFDEFSELDVADKPWVSNLLTYDLDRAVDTGDFIASLLFASAVDSFQSYLAHLLVEILDVDPRPIYGKNFPVKDIFAYDDLGELKAKVLERYVLELGYQNIDDLVDLLERNFGLKSLSHWLTRLRLNRYIQMRNIIAHNRGIVNRTYLFRSKSKVDEERHPVKTQHPTRPARYLGSLARAIDNEAVMKFALVEWVPGD